MKQNGANPIGQEEGRRARLSRVFLLLALAVCVLTLKICCAQTVQAAAQWLGLGAGGRAQAAFQALCDTLSAGGGAVEAFASSYQALTG